MISHSRIGSTLLYADELDIWSSNTACYIGRVTEKLTYGTIFADDCYLMPDTESVLHLTVDELAETSAHLTP